jgi:hypothetical protein
VIFIRLTSGVQSADLCSPNKAVTDQDEVLCIIPQLPPPLLNRLCLSKELPGALLSAALQLDPGLVKPGRALEGVTRHACAGILLQMSRSTTVAAAFEFLKDWPPAHKAVLCRTNVVKAVPGELS